jgi:hypothetical protein
MALDDDFFFDLIIPAFFALVATAALFLKRRNQQPVIDPQPGQAQGRIIAEPAPLNNVEQE